MQNILDRIKTWTLTSNRKNSIISFLKSIWENWDMTLFYIFFLVYIVFTIGYLTCVVNFPSIEHSDKILPSNSSYIDTIKNLFSIIKDAISISNPILILHPLSGSLMLFSFTIIFFKIINILLYDKKEIPKHSFIFLLLNLIIMIDVLLNTMYYSLKQIGLNKYIEQDLLKQEKTIFIIILIFIINKVVE